MAAPCLGHQCMEREYRATSVHGTVTGKKGTKCPDDNAIIKSIIDGWAKDAAEEEHCDEDRCRCSMPPWPATWTTLETNVTFTTPWADLECKADVSITYDWQCRERSAPCYRKAPTKGSMK